MKRLLAVLTLALLLGIASDARPQTRGGLCHITAATTTVCKAGRGVLGQIVINTPTAGTVTVFDALSAVAPVIAVITLPAATAPATLVYNLTVNVGITIVTSAATDLSVIFD